MAKVKKNVLLKKVKDITINSSLALALIGGLASVNSCRTASNAEEEYEEVESYSLGVVTYISEVSKDEFKITDEKEVPADSSKAVVKYLDGTIKNLTPEEAKNLIDQDLKSNNGTVREHNHLSNVLLYGGLGYMLSRSMRPNYSDFRQQNSSNGYSGGYGRYYSSPNVYEKSSGITNNIGNSRTITTRPVGGKSGFFSTSRQSSFRG